MAQDFVDTFGVYEFPGNAWAGWVITAADVKESIEFDTWDSKIHLVNDERTPENYKAYMKKNSLKGWLFPIPRDVLPVTETMDVLADEQLILNEQYSISGAFNLTGELNLLGGTDSSSLQSVTDLWSATTNDIEITTAVNGLILRAPDNTRWRVTIDNTGTLSTNIA